jgi:hypothetical protein
MVQDLPVAAAAALAGVHQLLQLVQMATVAGRYRWCWSSSPYNISEIQQLLQVILPIHQPPQRGGGLGTPGPSGSFYVAGGRRWRICTWFCFRIWWMLAAVDRGGGHVDHYLPS